VNVYFTFARRDAPSRKNPHNGCDILASASVFSDYAAPLDRPAFLQLTRKGCGQPTARIPTAFNQPQARNPAVLESIPPGEHRPPARHHTAPSPCIERRGPDKKKRHADKTNHDLRTSAPSRRGKRWKRPARGTRKSSPFKVQGENQGTQPMDSRAAPTRSPNHKGRAGGRDTSTVRPKKASQYLHSSSGNAVIAPGSRNPSSELARGKSTRMAATRCGDRILRIGPHTARRAPQKRPASNS